jgi:hypothetical protein
MPRPADGLVAAQRRQRRHAGRDGPFVRRETPVASTIPPMASTSEIGSPSRQCAWRGQAASTASQRSACRIALNARSPGSMYSVTDRVSLSPGRVRTEKDSSAVSGADRNSGREPPSRTRKKRV